MKRVLWIICCLPLMLGELRAQGIKFFHGTYEEALQQAKSESKQIFVDVYTSWCGPCKKMARDVFADEEVGRFYNDRFICLKLDAEKESDHAFFQYYQASAYPSFFWLDANGNLLDSSTGFIEADKFIRLGKDAEKSNLYVLLEEGKRRWNSGERSLDLVRTYVLGTLKKVHPQEVKGCLLDYFSTLSEQQLMMRDNYLLMRGFMRDLEDNIACHSLMKYSNIYQTYEKGYEFWISMYRMLVRAGSIFRDDNVKYEEHKRMIKNASFDYSMMYMEISEMEKLLFQKNFKKGIPEALLLVDKYGDKHPYLCSQFCYTLIIAGFFDKSIKNKKLIDSVIVLGQKALKNTPSKETLLYLAAAYAKKKDYKKAYELMASEPFFPEPILSTALYPYLYLSAIHNDYLNK